MLNRGMIAVLACVPALILPACSSTSEGCERAAKLTAEGRLAEAAEIYATAQRESDASCAAKGLNTVTKLQADALTATARGRAAETAGDLRGAQAAYEATLSIDQGSAEAMAGLRRVTRRPATIDPLWFKAQRLVDEGYVEEARAEVLAVLKAHPDRTVPESLADLAKVRPTPSQTSDPAAGPLARAAQAEDPRSPWWVIAVLVLFVIGLAANIGWTRRRLRLAGQVESDRYQRIDRRLDVAQEEFRATAQEARESLRSDLSKTSMASRTATARADQLDATVRALHAQLEHLRQVAAEDAGRTEARLQSLDAAEATQRHQLSLIVRTVMALRPRAGPVAEERYERAMHVGSEDTT